MLLLERVETNKLFVDETCPECSCCERGECWRERTAKNAVVVMMFSVLSVFSE